MKRNVRKKAYTHEGARACSVGKKEELKRAVMSCLLWEKQFYESGESIADRIKSLVPQVKEAPAIAIEAREDMKLRHVPLLICDSLAKCGKLKADTLSRIIQRPDELTEFLALYWMDKRQPLAAQVKKGLAKAFRKFDEYRLAKYNRDGTVKLKDVLFLTHPKPKDKDQEVLWKRLIDGSLKPPDTWEVSLSAGKDKRATWERLIKEGKLGALALLRNLRNMQESDVDAQTVFQGLASMNVSRVLPFRFIAAAKYAPQWESRIESALFRCTQDLPKLSGKTIFLIDVSGSMGWDNVSKNSDMTRLDAACGLGAIGRELCDNVEIYTFSNNTVLVPDRRGFALRDAITNSQSHGGTNFGAAVRAANSRVYDRIIAITDEQSHDRVPAPKGNGYIINVASYQNGVGYGPWTHINGFSESVFRYIYETEK